jgi:stage III sporulation protein AG
MSLKKSEGGVMSGWFDKIIGFTKDKKGKRKIENLVIFLILGVIIIIVASSFFSGDNNKDRNINTQAGVALLSTRETNEILKLEERLEQILQEIEGVGYVKVMLTGVSDGEAVYAYNRIEQGNRQEQLRDTEIQSKTYETRTESELVFMDGSSGERIPVEIKRINPEITGAVIVADGGGNSTVRSNIINAVEALLDIPKHRIQVLKRK